MCLPGGVNNIIIKITAIIYCVLDTGIDVYMNYLLYSLLPRKFSVC